jgi:hypothetical protein
VLRFLVPALLALAAVLPAQTNILPLTAVRAGMKGVGRTVFSGNRVEEFQVEVLGLLENVGPKEALILARLSGGPLEHTGVMQGMSGSPVYIDGKLVGAVAMAFPYAKDPIAGIRPIEDMLSERPGSSQSDVRRRAVALFDHDLGGLLPVAARPEGRMTDIATPVAFGGFSRGALEAFSPQLRALGLEPRQGITAGGRMPDTMGDAKLLQPGSMISVQLMSGDLSVGADGTVTYIDGKRVYAFGHRFLDVGATSLPFARSEVITLLASLNSSYKLSSAREWMGTITSDGSMGVTGTLGTQAPLVPLDIKLIANGREVDSYHMRMVPDTLLSPLLLQMALFSVIDGSQRTVGASTVRLRGAAEFDNAPPVRLDNVYSDDHGAAQQASTGAAVPFAYVMQSGFGKLALRKIEVTVEMSNTRRQLAVDGIYASRKQVRPGETLRLHVTMAGEDGANVTREAEYQVPRGAQPGTLFITVSDATVANFSDFRQILATPMRTPEQVAATVNALHPNNRAYVRVWRPEPAFQVEGVDLPAPPPSAALIFADALTSQAGVTQSRNSKLAQMELDMGEVVVTGSKTIQVEIKE